jgi:8-oxo-dGTP diphosphatase
MTERLLKILERWYICPITGLDIDECNDSCNHKVPASPSIAVDIIIEIQDWYPILLNRPLGSEPIRKRGIVLIEREYEPFGWALPGGHVDIGESTREAAIREAKEETGLDITGLKLLGVYDDPKRDPRRHMISIVYVAQAIGYPEANDDAKNAIIVDPTDIGYQTIGQLVCDHRQIITDYLTRNE